MLPSQPLDSNRSLSEDTSSKNGPVSAFSPAPVPNDFLADGGEMGALMRAKDWSVTPLGEVRHWPDALRTAVSICLNSRFPMVLWWGEPLALLYNDAWRPVLGQTKHPRALGSPGCEVWPEIWDIIGVQLNGVLARGEASWSEDLLLVLERNGFPEEAYFTYSYSPIKDGEGRIGGVFSAVSETTERVLSQRRLAVLKELAERAAEAKSVEGAGGGVAEVLARADADAAFALLYLADEDGRSLRLIAQAGLSAPKHVHPDAEDPWRLFEAIGGQTVELADLADRFGPLPGGRWPEPCTRALVLPVTRATQESATGVLVLGLSPRLGFDANYRNFAELVAAQVATAVANARAYEEERARAEALTELDRAKTTFFSNVSHEFRTPLTLMLGPLEETLSAPEAPICPGDLEKLQMVQRNGLRLLKLVNTLLDFSRIEAGRVQASYEPTDLAAYTVELASVFRSAIERAGLRLLVDCAPLPEPAYVDRDMWEKIVLNLLSNALKYTFAGEIAVSLAADAGRVHLSVRDTGTGIPEPELPRLFERFHRVEGARGRTHEGSGIGLALVVELVKLHGGSVGVTSVLGEGSTFHVSIPRGMAHLPIERIGVSGDLSSTALGAIPYVEEALRWLPTGLNGDLPAREPLVWLPTAPVAESPAQASHVPQPPGVRVVLADDNADMREYVCRLLAGRYAVEAVGDGLSALAAATREPPDLVLSDVMMPGMDGFALIQALREQPETREVPVILLSARAGEESRIEGLQSGADDYLVKPFSSRELLARVEANLALARLRAQAAEAEREARRVAEVARARVSDILESIGDNFIALDRDWRITYINAAAARLNQLAPEQLLGRTNWEVWPQTVGTDVERQYRRVVEEQTPAHFEVFYEQMGLWFEIHAYPAAEGLSVYFRDVTERKQTERTLAQQSERLAEANRLKDEFLATVSHELRTPLNAILGWTQMLLAGKVTAESTRRALLTIERNARTQNQLIEDILDVSRIISGKLRLEMQPMELTAVIEAALDTVRPAAEAKGIRLVAALDPEVGPVAGDSGRLQQVVWNLLSNAIKFTPRGGQVQIEVLRADGQVEIVVSDTGAGIPQSFLPHIFERFRQGDSSSSRSHGGLGLGLAIVRHLAELHGGSVAAVSPGEGQGAVFTVRLPQQTVPRVEGEPECAHPSAEGGTFDGTLRLDGVRVLAVDDEADARELLETILAVSGAQVQTAASAQQALALLRSWWPDVLLSDIGMPGEDGYALIKQVRALNPSTNLPAIALTAYARSQDRTRALVAGYQTHLSKPVDPAELVVAVASLASAPQIPSSDP